MEAFLAEYDWGVPLYRAVWQPLFLAASAALVFTAARAWGGRGGALGAWGIYAIVRLLATLMPVLAGRSPSAMPLLLASALCVELAAIAAAPRARPLAFGAIAGLACGAIGFAAEYGWSQLVMPLPWQPGLIAEALPTSIAAGLAGGMLGTLLACGLRSDLPSPRVTRAVTCGALALLVGLGVNAAIKETPDARATLALTDTRPAPDREAMAEVRLDPPDAADDANWLYLLGWQGRRDRVVDRLERVGDGVYRSTRPIPLDGTLEGRPAPAARPRPRRGAGAPSARPRARRARRGAEGAGALHARLRPRQRDHAARAVGGPRGVAVDDRDRRDLRVLRAVHRRRRAGCRAAWPARREARAGTVWKYRLGQFLLSVGSARNEGRRWRSCVRTCPQRASWTR